MARRLCAAVGLAGLMCAAGPASAFAQDPSTAPPPPGGGGRPGTRYLELLPDIGRIGAQVGAALGPSWNPYGAGSGGQVAAFIDLPLARTGGGRLSYEILLGLSGATGRPFALTGADGVRRSVRTRLRLLDVSPFALKYTLTGLDRVRLLPYVTSGLDVALAVTEERDEAGPLSERAARGLPDGDAALELGGHGGLGVELRVSRGLSLNLDYRYAQWGGGQSLHATSAVVGFHW